MQVVATELVLGEGVVAGDKVTVDPEESSDDEGEGVGSGADSVVGVVVGDEVGDRVGSGDGDSDGIGVGSGVGVTEGNGVGVVEGDGVTFDPESLGDEKEDEDVEPNTSVPSNPFRRAMTSQSKDALPGPLIDLTIKP